MAFDTTGRRVVLGSQSSTKLRCLRESGFEVLAIPSYANEEVVDDSRVVNKDDVVLEIAGRKIDVLKPRLEPITGILKTPYLVCGDVMVCTAAGHMLGKPRSLEEGIAVLNQYNKDGYFMSHVGVYVHNLVTKKTVSAARAVRINLTQPLDSTKFEAYLQNEGGLNACGALKIDNPLFQNAGANVLSDEEINAVKGMPTVLVAKLIEQVKSHGILPPPSCSAEQRGPRYQVGQVRPKTRLRI